jgi:hypothetical protein
MSDDAKTSLFLVFVVLIILALVDCAGGKKRFCPGVVRQHIYKAPYTSLSCTHDKHGSHCHTVYHPAQYRLLVECHNPDHVADINAGITNYTVIQNGESITVGERIGLWTNIIWGKWVQSRNTPKDY